MIQHKSPCGSSYREECVVREIENSLRGCFFMPMLFGSNPPRGHLVQENAPEAIIASLLRFL